MQVKWASKAAEDFQYWKKNDPQNVERIRRLIKSIQETPFQGLGKPEPLRNNWAGYWSRRITGEHRLVYKVDGISPNDVLTIAQCRFHY
jgi:toxin YoeB